MLWVWAFSQVHSKSNITKLCTIIIIKCSLTLLDRWAGPLDSTSQMTAGYFVPCPPRTENPNDPGRPSLSWALSSTTVFLLILSYPVGAGVVCVCVCSECVCDVHVWCVCVCGGGGLNVGVWYMYLDCTTCTCTCSYHNHHHYQSTVTQPLKISTVLSTFLACESCVDNTTFSSTLSLSRTNKNIKTTSVGTTLDTYMYLIKTLRQRYLKFCSHFFKAPMHLYQCDLNRRS